jgi:hypothetical protein
MVSSPVTLERLQEIDHRSFTCLIQKANAFAILDDHGDRLKTISSAKIYYGQPDRLAIYPTHGDPIYYLGRLGAYQVVQDDPKYSARFISRTTIGFSLGPSDEYGTGLSHLKNLILKPGKNTTIVSGDLPNDHITAIVDNITAQALYIQHDSHGWRWDTKLSYPRPGEMLVVQNSSGDHRVTKLLHFQWGDSDQRVIEGDWLKPGKSILLEGRGEYSYDQIIAANGGRASLSMADLPGILDSLHQNTMDANQAFKSATETLDSTAGVNLKSITFGAVLLTVTIMAILWLKRRR